MTRAAPVDYEHIRADDRIDLAGLAEIAPGKAIECRELHAGGSIESLLLQHSYSAAQLHCSAPAPR